MRGAVLIGGTSDKYQRSVADFYVTPVDVTQSLIDTGIIPSGTVWEPACGNGHMANVLENNGFDVVASDIRETGYGYQSDFLTAELPGNISAIITNPPFNQATQFIERCIELEVPCFAMLLKTQNWHSKNRAGIFEKHPPAHIMALTWRPVFCQTERGGRPTMDMLWSIWIRGNTDTRYRVLRKPVIPS